LHVTHRDLHSFPTRRSSDLAPGSLGRLGPYEITDVIGRGGMGIVLKAFHPPLNRHVAIKVLAAEWAHNATARRRFAREAKAAARSEEHTSELQSRGHLVCRL